MKYAVINGSKWGTIFNIGLIAKFDDLDSAKECARQSIAEDFGCRDFEEFKEDFGYDTEKESTYPLYMISRYDGDSHDEIYKVYEI